MCTCHPAHSDCILEMIIPPSQSHQSIRLWVLMLLSQSKYLTQPHISVELPAAAAAPGSESRCSTKRPNSSLAFACNPSQPATTGCSTCTHVYQMHLRAPPGCGAPLVAADWMVAHLCWSVAEKHKDVNLSHSEATAGTKRSTESASSCSNAPTPSISEQPT